MPARPAAHRCYGPRIFRALLTSVVIAVSACHDPAGGDRTRPGALAVGDVVWRVEPGIASAAQWWGIPATAEARLFIDVGNSIKAFATEDGRELWSTVVRPGRIPESQNLIAQSGLVLVSDNLAVVALDQATGTERWKVTPNDSLMQSFGAADAAAYYIGTRGGYVYALALSSGATLWEVDLKQSHWLAGNVIGMALSGDTLAVSGVLKIDPATYLPQAFVIALDRRDGKELWRYESTTGAHGVYSSPTMTDKLVLLPDVLQKKMIALDRSNGSVRWVANTAWDWGGPGSEPFVRDGVVYFGNHGGNVYAVDLETGAIKWTTYVHNFVDHVVLCGNHVFASTHGGSILEPATGKWIRDVVTGREDFLTSHWAVSGNRIFASGMVAVYALSCG